MLWGWEKASIGKIAKKRARPWWWGSWMLQPFAFGQLLYTLVFDRDCFPTVSLASLLQAEQFSIINEIVLTDGLFASSRTGTSSSSIRAPTYTPNQTISRQALSGQVRTISSIALLRWLVSIGRECCFPLE